MNAPSLTANERDLIDRLVGVFTGIKIEGKSGFVSLINVKESFFRSTLRRIFIEFISSVTLDDSKKQVVYNDVLEFFQSHFSETGSIFSEKLKNSELSMSMNDSNHEVSLKWITQFFYYVKTDRLWRNSSMRYSIDGKSYTIVFDVSDMRHKSRNEKRPLNFSLKSVRPPEIVFRVTQSTRTKTDLEGICETLKKHGVQINTNDLESVLKTFKKPRSAEYFIHKNAREFLSNQLDLWLYLRFYSKNLRIKADDVDNRIQPFQSLAARIIECVGQFEDFLVKIWNKPKFVLKSNYVITLDRISKTADGKQLLRLLALDSSFNDQVSDWLKLRLINESEIQHVSELLKNGNIAESKYRYLPIDTRFLNQALKQSLVSLFDDLDSAIDGWLIHSENYQALNTIMPRFREHVKLIYIDPPFNLGSDSNLQYNVDYTDAVWLSLLENRLTLAKDLLRHDGSIFVRCDYNGNMYVRLLLNEIFGRENFRNEIVIRRGSAKAGLFTQFKEQKSLGVVYDNIYWFSKNPDSTFLGFRGSPSKRQREGYWSSFKKIYNRPTMRYEILGVSIDEGQWMWKKEKAMKAVENYQKFLKEHEATGISLRKYWESSGKKLSFVRRRGNAIQYWVAPRESVLLDNCWTDIAGYSSLWSFKTENSEALLKRIIEATSSKGDLVMDFFLGSGTTIAVAHKLGRKWIGIEMGDHFHSIILSRMKHVLAYDKKGVSNEVPDYKGGGFFKYYELEQYDHCLTRIQLSNDELSGDLYSLNISNDVIETVDLGELIEGIDVPETISNLIGCGIRQIHEDEFVLHNGMTLSLDFIEVPLILPLILIND